jgi:hypothetical protein
MSFNMGSAFTCPTCTHEKTPYPCIYMHSPGSVVLWWLLLTGVSKFCTLPSAQQPYQPRPVGLQLPRRLHQQRTWHSRRANNRLAPLKLHAVLKVILCSPLCLLGTSFSPLFTTPETWLRECDKMVMHRCTLIVCLPMCALPHNFSPGSHLVTTEPCTRTPYGVAQARCFARLL